MNLQDATPLGLVDVGSHRLHASPWPRQWRWKGPVVYGPGVTPLVQNEVTAYMQRGYGPGGPMGPMAMAYRDWPPR